MQDIHAIGDGSGGGRFTGVGDRRLRPNHQPLKCPRCDSFDTKFCYYNNYNHSQPRHFCKSCRRYWTKGGVLRNVPVGGGCRKTKRSRAKGSGDAPRKRKSNAQSSSSESSSITAASVSAATATTPTSAVAEEGSAPSNTTSWSSTVVYNFADARFCNVPISDHQPLVNHPSTNGQIFSTEMGSFTSMMTSSEDIFGTGDIATTSYGWEQLVNPTPVAENPSPAPVVEFKMEDMSDEGVAVALDWRGGGGGGGDLSLFDLTAGVDPDYWNQSEWIDDDRSLMYLP